MGVSHAVQVNRIEFRLNALDVPDKKSPGIPGLSCAIAGRA